MTDASSSSRRESTILESATNRLSILGSSRSALQRPLSTAGSGISSSLLYGVSAEEKVVLDMGSFTLRAGFSNDSAPLHTCELFGEFKAVGPSSRRKGQIHGLLDPSVATDEETLDALLLEQLREVYRTHLLLDPKSRKVAIAEGALLPIQIKRALARVLLGNLRVPQLSFYPSSVAGLMTCGATSGLVIDCGHRSTSVIPIYDCRPLTAYMTYTPMGGYALFKNLRGLLKKFGRFQPFDKTLTDQPVDDHMLDDQLCYHLLNNLLYASPLSLPATKLTEASNKGLGVGKVSQEIAEWFESSVTASSPVTRMDVESLQHGHGALLFPSWIRERTVEVLLMGDGAQEHPGLVETVVQCIKRAPVDTRRELVKHILVVGGVADMPNIRMRMLQDLIARLQRDSRWAALANDVALAEERLTKDTNGSVFRPSERCWIGVSLAVAAKIGGLDIRRDEFDGYNVPDWTSIIS
ncbi:actin-like ATPase domain-containing protein [Coemansia reversa NRRL 1564]|uniref:Actin-like ATPase domain-containing protein n=1 Tax=Coemansia reversa (strain ATCC 12441 / NRRL 1564) TaxID=763665 RepID=A0A2G5BES6_COERN|nr:actin-like ATPase domain-containing protein [Coemansia reversa NRRL 1564]|eukprot:PIA17518.1 actin-like ATPase domain-containing protein [Coemansia reversa NRRL 1564]